LAALVVTPSGQGQDGSHGLDWESAEAPLEYLKENPRLRAGNDRFVRPETRVISTVFVDIQPAMDFHSFHATYS